MLRICSAWLCLVEISSPPFQPLVSHDLPGADAHVEAGDDHYAAGDGDRDDEQNQREVGVEVDYHELGVQRVVVALVHLDKDQGWLEGTIHNH